MILAPKVINPNMGGTYLENFRRQIFINQDRLKQLKQSPCTGVVINNESVWVYLGKFIFHYTTGPLNA